MRVGLDGYALATPRTGIGHYTLELARALAATSPEDEFELVSPVPFTSVVLQEITSPNLRTVTADVPFRGRWWAAGLPLYVRRASLDIFHGTNYDVPLWNWRRTVVTIHDLSVLLHSDKHQPHLVRRARIRLQTMARLATLIITPTEAVKREICHYLHVGSDKIAVTPYAARASFRQVPYDMTLETRQRLRVEDEFVLFVGTIEPRKNVLTLVRAFAEVLRHSSASPQLVVVGPEGWLMDDLFSYVRSAGISDRLHFTGYVTDDDLRNLYSSCRILVYPSIYEGFGLPPLEGMACGAPVITSDIPSISETVGNAAYLVNPRDEQDLARKILDLLGDENKRRWFSSTGLERAREFSWAKTARLTMRAYGQVLNMRDVSVRAATD